jgi:hypothetical protein
MDYYNLIDCIFFFDAEKSTKLIKIRGFCFEEIIEVLESKGPLDVFKHPNADKYPNQMVYAIEFNGNVYLVPFIKDGDKVFLKTAFPSRKATRRYLYN